MASIYKRGNVWWIHYLIGGKSVSRSLETSNERVALEAKKKLEALNIVGQLSQPSNTPLETFLQSFCEFLLSTRTRKSAKNDISYLRTFFGPCCLALQLGSNVPDEKIHSCIQAEARYYLGRYFEFYNNQRFHQALDYRTPAEVYARAVGTPVALRAPSVPTAITGGDESTLKTTSFLS